MSKDTTSPDNYKEPTNQFLKIHEEEPSYGQFKIIPEIMSARGLSLKKKILLFYVVQLQDDGYCHASNAWFAKTTGTLDVDGISTHLVEMDDKFDLIKIKNIYNKATGEFLQRRIRLRPKLISMLNTLPCISKVPLPREHQEIVPKGTETSKSLKKKSKVSKKMDPLMSKKRTRPSQGI